MRSADGTAALSAGDGAPHPPRRPAKRSKWPLLVVALLAAHVMILVVVVLVATRDPSFAVTPNYYENAVHWDQSQAQRRASEKLGWRLEVAAADEAERDGSRAVTFTLADAAGTPLTGAKLDVTCFHHAHANQPVHLNATTAADGRATQVMPLRRAGFWDFQCLATAADGRTFTQTITQYVNPPVRLAKAALP